MGPVRGGFGNEMIDIDSACKHCERCRRALFDGLLGTGYLLQKIVIGYML